MRKGALTLLLAGVLGAAAPGAFAQSSSTLVGFGLFPGAITISQTDIPVAASGQLVVTFRGDDGAGCAALGVCGYSGTVIVRPGDGTISVLKYRQHGRIAYQAALLLGGGAQETETLAEVARSAGGGQAGLCADVEKPFAEPAITFAGSVATLSLLQPGGTLLTTRCAGPLDRDVIPVAPQVSIPRSALLRGHRQLSLSGDGSIVQGGFSDRVSSTIVLHLGKPSRVRLGRTSFPRGINTKRTRLVTQKLKLIRAAGTLRALVHGTPDANVCVLLDSCGLAGTITLAPRPVQATGELIATGTATRPYRDFLAALGRSTAGDPRGIGVVGDIGWNTGGSIISDLTQSGTCVDTEQLGGGGIGLQLRGDALIASYTVASPRTRCPGPLLGSNKSLAAGKLARRQLVHHTFTIQVHSARTLFPDDGYLATLGGGLSFTIQGVGHPSQQVILEPTG